VCSEKCPSCKGVIVHFTRVQRLICISCGAECIIKKGGYKGNEVQIKYIPGYENLSYKIWEICNGKIFKDRCYKCKNIVVSLFDGWILICSVCALEWKYVESYKDYIEIRREGKEEIRREEKSKNSDESKKENIEVKKSENPNKNISLKKREDGIKVTLSECPDCGRGMINAGGFRRCRNCNTKWEYSARFNFEKV
jgi:uncharacterized Zn finger protein (UPF0148 family)